MRYPTSRRGSYLGNTEEHDAHRTAPHSTAPHCTAPHCTAPCAALLLGFLLLLGSPSSVFAGTATGTQYGSCITSSQDHHGLSQRRDYLVNLTSFSPLGLNSPEARAAVLSGADAWNDMTASSWFRYVGHSTHTYTPSNFPCGTSTPSLVYAIDGCTNQTTIARASAVCGDGRFIIRFWRFREDGNGDCTVPNDLEIGSPHSGRDLISIAAHEFGHTLRLGHANDVDPDYHAVMRSSGAGAMHKRDLMNWDVHCARVIAGYHHPHHFGMGSYRWSRPHYSIQSSSGAFGSPTVFNPDTPTVFASHASVARVHNGSSWQWLWGMHRGDGPTNDRPRGWWGFTLGSSSTYFVDSSVVRYAGGPVSSIRREWNNNDVYQLYLREVQGSFTQNTSERRRLQQAFFPWPSYPSGVSSQSMYECLAHASAHTCSGGLALIYPTRRPGVGYDFATSNSLLAWNRTDRTSDTAHGQLAISVGHADAHSSFPGFSFNYIVGTADDMGVRSHVGPAVACRASNGPLPYRCIVAFVGKDVRTALVRVFRFNVGYDSSLNRYRVYRESFSRTISTGLGSGNDLAAWYSASTGRFYVAARALAVEQPLWVYSSIAGDSWSFETDLGEIATGPSAANTPTFSSGSQTMLMYVR